MARTKPRLFAFPREVELAPFLHDSSTDPQKLRLLEDVVDTFAAIARTKVIGEELLDPFEQAARHPDPEVRGLGLLRLSVLCHYFPQAADRYARLVRDPDPDIRRFAVTVLANTPASVISGLLPEALSDSDWGVRKAAATIAGALPLPALQPVFRERLDHEADARVRVVLQLAVEHQSALAAH